MARKETFGVEIVGKESVSKAAKKAEGGLSSLTKSMGIAVIAGNLLADVFRNIGRAISNFVKKGVNMALSLEGMEAGFKRLAEDSDNFLKELTRVTKGTVSQFELMKQANQALLLGIDQKAIPAMFKGAAVIAQAAGQDITFALESITTGIGRQSRMMLDNLGIIVRAEDAYRTYAKSIGKSKDALTEVERKIAFTEAATKALNERVERLGGELLPTTKAAIDNLKASLSELQSEIGEHLLINKEWINDLTVLIDKANELAGKSEDNVFWREKEKESIIKSIPLYKRLTFWLNAALFVKKKLIPATKEWTQAQKELGTAIFNRITSLQDMTAAEREEYFAELDLIEAQKELHFKQDAMNKILDDAIAISKGKTEAERLQIQVVIDLKDELANLREEVMKDNKVTDEEILKIMEKAQAYDTAKKAVDGLANSLQGLSDIERAQERGFTGDIGGGRRAAIIIGHKPDGTPVWGAPGTNYNPPPDSSTNEADTT